MLVPIAFVLFLVCTACATAAKGTFRGYAGPDRPAQSVATIYLGDAAWVKIDYLHATSSSYATVEVPPGVYKVEWGVYPLGLDDSQTRWTVMLEAGSRYMLHACRQRPSDDCGAAPEHRFFLWIVDVTQQRVVAGQRP